MRHLSTSLFMVLCAALLLGNSQCQNNSASSSPTFVTTMAVEDANGNPETSFSSGQTIQFVLNVRNRTGSDQTIYMNICFPKYEFVVLTAGTSTAVATPLGPGGIVCLAIGVGPVTFPAGQTASFTFDWDQTDTNGQLVATGSYEVMGGLICFYSSSLQAPDTVDCMNASNTNDQLSPALLRSTLAPFTIQ
ncbi:MAG TPA: hypothetical protein VNF46_07110 [Gammaproteobacteria bacterium]|nr:hypothetical protein [Gammaproteobacteria bacterium]